MIYLLQSTRNLLTLEHPNILRFSFITCTGRTTPPRKTCFFKKKCLQFPNKKHRSLKQNLNTDNAMNKQKKKMQQVHS